MKHPALLAITMILGVALVPANDGRSGFGPGENQGRDNYIELMVAVDRSRWEGFENEDAMIRYLEQVVGRVNDSLDTLESAVTGEFELVLSKVVVVCEAPEITLAYPDQEYGPGEVDYSDLLSDFHSWRRRSGIHHDYGVYLTGQDLYGSVISYGSVASACVTSSAGTVVQSQYNAELDALSLARDLGLAFDVRFDGQGNTCSESGFVMSPIGNPGAEPPTAYSSCSLDYVERFFRTRSRTYLGCMDNSPANTGTPGPVVFVGCG